MLRTFLIAALISCAWGWRNSPSHRIVGGSETTIQNFPWTVSLRRVITGHFCGGAILTPIFVLTAAHCVHADKHYFLQVRAGSTNRNRGGVVKSVRKILSHEQYFYPNEDYDIAILTLAESFSFNQRIRPVIIPASSYELLPGLKVKVSGWGDVSEAGNDGPIRLRFVEVEVIDALDCTAAYPLEPITPRMFCAGVDGGGNDACQGDSGGPLTTGNLLVGLVSFGNGCGRPNFPGVYTNIINLRNWIFTNM